MSSTIPQMIKLMIPELRNKGVAETTLTQIQNDLSAGRTREAVVRYDAAARMTEVLGS